VHNQKIISNDIINIIRSVLHLDRSCYDLTSDTRLFGSIPEFDSMAVIAVISAIEENYNIRFLDDEIDAGIFETIGTLIEFVSNKL
jgi:acyl carrier protein